MELDGKVAIVTGAASGIGAALASGLASRGVRVVIGDLDEAGAHAGAEAIRSGGGQAIGLRADASDVVDIEGMITLASREFDPVDIYIANAGIIGRPGLGTEQDWDTILDVNLRAHIRAARLLVPHWQSTGSGYFVSVASADSTAADCSIDDAPSRASGSSVLRTACSSGVFTPSGHTQLTPIPSSP